MDPASVAYMLEPISDDFATTFRAAKLFFLNFPLIFND